MRYVTARYRQHQREVMYRIYLTDVLRNIGENAAASARGKYIPTRYADLYFEKKEDNRSGQEIFNDIVERSGIKAVKR